MHFIDKRINELEHYITNSPGPDDLDAFWKRTLKDAGQRALNDRREPVEALSEYYRSYKVVYEGYDDTPIHGWFLLPSFAAAEALPCIVYFHGYYGSKEYPESYAKWLLMGYAVFAIDVRGQSGETGNALPQHFGMTKGWITQGLLDPEQSYYRAITVDALKAVEWAAGQPEVDSKQITVVGGSQGGGLALITGALSDIPAKVIADIPNMCHMDYGIMNSTGSLAEAAAFVSKHPERLEQVLRTLSYFDMLHLCDRLRVPVFMSVGLKDTICMPETIFAVYNRMTVPKELQVLPFNGHHVSGDHFRRRIEFIRKAF